MNTIMKKCSGTCGQTLELNKDNFGKRKASNDGFRNQCRNCYGKGVPTHIIEENGIKYQVCTGECKLKLEISVDNFEWRNDQNKFRRKCINCRNNKKQEYYEENKVKILVQQKEYYEENKEEILKRDKIYRDKPENKEKIKEYQNEYYKENKEDILKVNKTYRDKHKNKISKQKKEYANRPEIKQRNRLASIKKRKENIQEKIRHSVSNSILKAIKKNGGKKSGSILDYLPYTIEELKIHIESLFEDWMNWDNWKKYNPETWIEEDKSTWTWNLDHKDPHSGFKYDSMDHPDFFKCWNLNNLRPYSSKLNQHDGSTRIRHRKK